MSRFSFLTRCIFSVASCAVSLAAANPPPGGDQALDPPLPPGAADDLEQRMRARRAAAGEDVPAPPAAQTQPTGAIQDPLGGPGFGGGAFGLAPPRAAWGARSVPPEPNWAAGNWSKEMDGVRGTLHGPSFISARRGLVVHFQIWHAEDRPLEFCTDDPACWTWVIRDSAGKIVPANAVAENANTGGDHPGKSSAGSRAAVEPQWSGMGRGLVPGQGEGIRSDNADPFLLRFDQLEWRLAPGDYAIRATFVGPSKVPGVRADVPVWKGTLEFPPEAFTVYGPFDPEKAQQVAAKLRAQTWKDPGDLYRALAKLIPPDATEEQLKEILPSGAGAETGGGTTPRMYPLDDNFVVELSGSNRRGPNGETSYTLYAPPRVMTKREYTQEHKPGQRGGN